MISTYKIKPAFQKLLTPLLKVLRKLGVTPNLLTVKAILLSLFLGYLFYEAESNNTYYLYVALGLLFRMMLNALDGMMARVYDLQSRTGEVLNEVGDIVSDVVIYVFHLNRVDSFFDTSINPLFGIIYYTSLSI